MTDSPDKPLSDVFKKLSEELGQEKELKAEESYLSSVDQNLFRNREPEYRDIEKQYVRWQWLAQAKEISTKNGRRIKYLTLPAYYRLDVSLFEREKILRADRESDEPLLEVAAFEAEPTKFARMAGKGHKLRLFAATEIESALLDSQNPYYEQLAELFPFDVVNFDLTTSLTPKHEGPYSRIMQAIEEVFTRQGAQVGAWGLFLTFRNMRNEWEQNALEQFVSNLQQNLDYFPKVQEAFSDRYQKGDVKELLAKDEHITISQAVTKWIVDRAHHHLFKVDSVKSFRYTRTAAGTPPYVISKLLFTFSKGTMRKEKIPMKHNPRQSWMEDGLVKCVREHTFIDVSEKLKGLPESKRKRLEAEVEELAGLIEPS
jgi:hypothetical protein